MKIFRKPSAHDYARVRASICVAFQGDGHPAALPGFGDDCQGPARRERYQCSALFRKPNRTNGRVAGVEISAINRDLAARYRDGRVYLKNSRRFAHLSLLRMERAPI
jgi:hypothetical protein